MQKCKKKPGAGPGVKPDTDRQTLSWACHLKVGDHDAVHGGDDHDQDFDYDG